MKVSFKHKGDFSKTFKFFDKIKTFRHFADLEKYGREGVAALSSSTPYDTGNTAGSWSYEIENRDGLTTISFNNSHVNNGVNIAIILQYGHATRTGGWVQGRDYINPAIQPIFDKLADAAWKEVIGS